MKGIFDCSENKFTKRELTDEELRELEKQKQEPINSTIVEEQVDAEKVVMAEALIDLNNQIEDLKNEINNLKGGK